MSPLTESTRVVLAKDFTWNESIWNPSMTQTALWLDAADASTVTTVSGAVSQWNDKSGNLRHCYQSVASYRPAYQVGALSGKNCVRFISSDYLYSSLPLDLTTGYDFFVVAMNRVRKDFNGLFSIRAAIQQASRFEVYWQAGSLNSGNLVTVYNRGGSFVGSQTNNTGPLPGSYYIHSVSGGLPITRYIQGVALGANEGFGSGPGYPAASDPYFVGIGYGDNGNTVRAVLDGDICEIIVCPVTTSTQLRQKIEGYLAHKWGLTTSLPSGHPYKNVGPIS